MGRRKPKKRKPKQLWRYRSASWDGQFRWLLQRPAKHHRVPGGWIYHDMKTGTIVFVPMPEVVNAPDLAQVAAEFIRAATG